MPNQVLRGIEREQRIRPRTSVVPMKVDRGAEIAELFEGCPVTPRDHLAAVSRPFAATQIVLDNLECLVQVEPSVRPREVLQRVCDVVVGLGELDGLLFLAPRTLLTGREDLDRASVRAQSLRCRQYVRVPLAAGAVRVDGG